VETAQIQVKVLMLGTDPLVRDNVRVLLKSMGYQCLVASTLKEAAVLLRQEKPDAAILDPRLADSPPAHLVISFLRRVRELRARFIVLVGEESDPELIQVLDAYSVPRVRLDLVLQELWPILDSLLRRPIVVPQVMRDAPLVFDSFLQPSLVGTRSLQPALRQLRYESENVITDLSLEGQKDLQRITLTGQVLDIAKRDPHLRGVPIIIQGQAGPIGIAKTNEWGEFQYEFGFEPGVTLEIGARENLWVSVELPDMKSVMRRT
jgi:DNA-binding response OmpR family regulator